MVLTAEISLFLSGVSPSISASITFWSKGTKASRDKPVFVCKALNCLFLGFVHYSVSDEVELFHSSSFSHVMDMFGDFQVISNWNPQR